MASVKRRPVITCDGFDEDLTLAGRIRMQEETRVAFPECSFQQDVPQSDPETGHCQSLETLGRIAHHVILSASLFQMFDNKIYI